MANFQNTGGIDRLIRFILAVVAATVAYNSHGWARTAWIVVTIIMLISGISGFTLPYKLIGINTKKK